MANAGPSDGALSKIFGPKKRTKDIELPNESGKVDPRIKKKKGIFDRYNPLTVLSSKIEEALEKK